MQKNAKMESWWILVKFTLSKELDDLGFCKNDYVWNPSTCDCECNKACKIDKYLDFENCLCKNV